MNRIRLQKSMKECLQEAFKKNAVISSDGLSDNEFILVINGKAYFEDGCCLGSYSRTFEVLASQEWTKRYPWYVIGYMNEEEVTFLRESMKKPRCYESVWLEQQIKKAFTS